MERFIATLGTQVPTHKYPSIQCRSVETGALVHEPSMVELASWKTRCTMLGVILLIVAGLGVYIGLASSIDDVGAGGSAAMVTIMTVVAGAAIAVFGLRYLMLGFKGRVRACNRGRVL